MCLAWNAWKIAEIETQRCVLLALRGPYETGSWLAILSFLTVYIDSPVGIVQFVKHYDHIHLTFRRPQ